MATQKSSAPPARRTTRKARTNKGMLGALERNYWRGSLTDEQQERFEALIHLTRSLYKVTL